MKDSTKFIDLFRAKDKRQPNKRRAEHCPYPEACYPLACHISTTNQAGVCVGLLDESPNLDCIRQCNFIREGEKLMCLEHFMTPDEALDDANCLIWAVRCSLDFASSYQKYHKALCEARKNGDNRPSEL